eukprot:CAMPEP_0198220032 /NCGR_PEP_ID=MMETSP1445-20131203/77249_1 /TAXON_ID=36898 /ORGANISM="Pyramimonas sp., Strain CCMP2087" /LENGTH=248 /DNA_ID=CAMNT_0043897655 /DNA_START=626 /DNA_END=1371 /DNA_ORIENTATION=+
MSARDYRRRVLPIGALYAASLWLSNSAYIHLSVSFIQMTKALMPGLVYMIGVFMRTEKYTLKVTLNMLVIAIGVGIAAVWGGKFCYDRRGGAALKLGVRGRQADARTGINQLAGFDDEPHPESVLRVAGMLHVSEHPVRGARAAGAAGSAALGPQPVGAGGECVHSVRPQSGGILTDWKDLRFDDEHRRGDKGLDAYRDVHYRVRGACDTVEYCGILCSVYVGLFLQPCEAAGHEARQQGSDQELEGG